MTDRGPIIRRSVDLATRKPWHVMAVWGIAFVLMAVAGIGAKHILKAEDLVISGTASGEAIKAEKNAFGRSSPLTVALTGPAAELDRHGPRAVRSIERIDGVSVSSPWTDGAPELLRERPDRALLVVSIDRELHEAGNDVVPVVRARLSEHLPASVKSAVAGQARFSSEFVNLALSGVQKAELLAMPFLLLILLLIFRAPIAAALPLFQGVVVIVLTTGVVTLLGRVIDVNVLAQGSGSVIGLALGVDYSLLFVSRFRDELAAGASVNDAVARAIETAGRTVVFAGGILVLAALLMVAFTVGWASMGTGSIGVVLAATFSVLAALTLLPACLALLGENINRWPIGRVTQNSALAPLVNRMIQKPAAASILVLIPLLFLCAQALGMNTGGPDARTLDADNPVRSDLEAVSEQYGGGVMSPYQVLVRSKDGPITSPSDIKALEKFQLKLAADPKVKYVLGPGTTRVRRVSDSAESSPTQIAKFEYGLGAASTGVGDLRRGLRGGAKGASAIAGANNSALAGAQQIQSGVGAAADGAGRLSSGLSKSASGSRQLDAALDELNSGAAKIRSAVRGASGDVRGLASGSQTLKNQLDQANSSLAQINQGSSSGAASALASAKSSLDGMSAAAKAEPEFQSAYQSLESAQSEVSSQNNSSLGDLVFKYNAISDAFGLGVKQASTAASDASKLSSAVGRLSGGIDTVAKNSGLLSSGLGQLSDGSGALRDGLAPLQNGASALSSGLGQLGSGSGQLGAGLQSGYTNSRPLESGLRKLRSSAANLSKSSTEPVDLKAVSKSAYLTMALLSAAPPEQKQNLRLVLNEQRGGDAARIYLITKDYPTSKALVPFADRLNVSSQRLARELDADVAVGGPGQSFLDYDRFTHSRILPLVLALSLLSFLFLLVVFRSLLLAAKAVVLNMITVGAAMGVIELLYGGSDPVFGGPGWMEATSFFVVFSTTFALSMDYEIFMINRMRESWINTGSNEIAIRDGVTKTAGIVTGSALVMCVLFLAVAFTSETVSNAQMGLGLAVAIAIDATVVRLILLPASMRLFGDANWYLPPWLDRLLPNVAIH